MVWFKKKTVCTHCNKNSAKREFEGKPTCAECKGAWLDAGEIEAIKEAARSEGVAVGMVCF